jgi:hypothetical protein
VLPAVGSGRIWPRWRTSKNNLALVWAASVTIGADIA